MMQRFLARFSVFQDKISTLAILAAFIPVLMDTGGNAGGQTTAVMVRALALKEFEPKDYFKVVWKEVRSAMIVAAIVASFAFIWFTMEQYTGIVVIDARPGGNFGRPGGGYMAGPVFRNFAEQVYANSIYLTVNDIKPDSANIANYGMFPKAKRGPELPTREVTNELGFDNVFEKLDARYVNLNNVTPGIVPDVQGMGAADALYMLENAGLRVNVSGLGKVTSQSLVAGSSFTKGQTISITLK